MKTTLPAAVFLTLALPLAAATKPGADTPSPAPKPAKNKDTQAATAAAAPGGATKPAAATTPAPATPAPVAAPAAASPAGNASLDAYISALNDTLKLSKDEKQDITTYYLDDGAKLQQILNDPSLSPMQQTAQVDDLRNTRNAKIEALLRDVDRQVAFLKIEAVYRVALIELAADGGLVPAAKPPNVPEPTATPPAQAPAPKV
jgi:2-oxoglutarate dehydrogenase E2 component (dihydrolipoamide succinyltransferase)